jgi:hypothetical protein
MVPSTHVDTALFVADPCLGFGPFWRRVLRIARCVRFVKAPLPEPEVPGDTTKITIPLALEVARQP